MTIRHSRVGRVHGGLRWSVAAVFAALAAVAGDVRTNAQADVDFQSTFCSETVLAGIEGFRCVLPFNWAFELPAAFIGEEWLVTLQAQGGRGGSGGTPGQAQTTRTTTGLANRTLYAWVGANAGVSTTIGGGGGGASALALTSDPFSAVTSSGATEDLLLVAGGSGGGVALDGQCASLGGSGGVAVASSSTAVIGAGAAGQGGTAGGGGGSLSSGVWTGGAGGAPQGPSSSAESEQGAPGASGLTFFGGLGFGEHSNRAGTLTSIQAPTTPRDAVFLSGGSGGEGYEFACRGGGGGAGIAAGGGGAGGFGEGGVVSFQGGGGGGGASYAAASDVTPTEFPSWADRWLTQADQTQGLVSLFFFQSGTGPPPVPADGATVDGVQPTLGFEGDETSFSYVISEVGSGTTSLGSRSTGNARWTIPSDGALTPGTTYSWEVFDGDGNSVQSARTFTVAPSATAGTQGVTMEMRSMNYWATQQSNAPAYLVPESGQAVPTAQVTESTPSCYPSTCFQWSAVLGDPDDYGTYFTTSTAVQGTTNPGAINVDWATFDPFGLGLSELFTLRVTATLTVPVSGEYTFGVNAYGGARLTLTDPSGAAIPGASIDTWGEIEGCAYTGPENGERPDQQQVWADAAYANAAFACVNTQEPKTGAPVSLTAGTPYTLEMDGFMSWLPGPFQLLYTSAALDSELAPVPAAWLSTTGLPSDPDPELPTSTAPVTSTASITTAPSLTPPAEVTPPPSADTLAPVLPATGPSSTAPTTALAVALVALGGALLAVRRRT